MHNAPISKLIVGYCTFKKSFFPPTLLSQLYFEKHREFF